MSKSYKKGFNWWLDDWADRVRRDDDTYPMSYHGQTFKDVEEYIAWYRRKWTSGHFGCDIGGAFKDAPKGIDNWETAWGPSRKRSAKKAVSRIRRIIGKDMIRAALKEMEEDDGEE